MRRISEAELNRIQAELAARLETRLEPTVTADFATRALARMLNEYRALERENAALRLQPSA